MVACLARSLGTASRREILGGDSLKVGPQNAYERSCGSWRMSEILPADLAIAQYLMCEACA